MLVYENYNKFITATDTIRQMSSSMEGMDDRMKALRQLIGGCAWERGGPPCVRGVQCRRSFLSRGIAA